MRSGDILAGKYRLVHKLGAGAMGEVWAGENQATGGKVALKLIIPTAPKDRTSDLRVRLEREARACGKLSHRNIVQIYDVDRTPEGDPFLVLELLRGKPLDEQLKDTRRIEPPMAARIGAEIASALAVAHEKKIIHRDLKPANIFLHQEEGVPDDRFIVKVLDFGVAKNLDGGADGPATVTNVAVGSPAYMSPEQVAMRKDLDGRTDIWSLGVVLYEMLAGARPFTGNVDEVIRQIVLTKGNKVPPPSIKVRSVPPEFDEIVGRCLENDRERRYANASELALALQSVAESSRSMRMAVSVAVPPAPGPQRAPTWPGVGVPQAPPSVAARPPMGSTPAIDLDDAATLHMQKNVLAGMMAAHGGAPQAEQRATGTMLMASDQPVESPDPVWKQQMQEWRANRQPSSSNVEAPVAADLVHNGTQALDPDVVMRAKAGAERTTGAERAATTSTIGAMSQPIGAYPAPPGLAQSPGNAPQRRKRSSGLFFAMMGVGSLAAVGVVAVLLLNTSQGEGEGTVAGPTTPQAVGTAAPAVAPPAVTEAKTAAPAPEPPPSSVPSSAPMQVPTVAPPARAAPAGTATTNSARVAPAGTVKTPAGSSSSKPTSTATPPGLTRLCKEGNKLVRCKQRRF
jgi:serine/threonine-protein kinase